MIEQIAVVVKVDGDFAWVQAERQSTCGNCAARSGCGTSVLSKVIGTKIARMRAINKPQAQVGDTVVVGLSEAAMLKGSVVVYLLPLLLMFLFAITGNVIATQIHVTSEVMSIGFAVAGLAIGGGLLQRFNRRIQSNEQYQPVVLKKVMPVGRVELPVPHG